MLGICIVDFVELVEYYSFAPYLYLSLKRDCQYWSAVVEGKDDEDDDELQNLVTQTNEVIHDFLHKLLSEQLFIMRR